MGRHIITTSPCTKTHILIIPVHCNYYSGILRPQYMYLHNLHTGCIENAWTVFWHEFHNPKQGKN